MFLSPDEIAELTGKQRPAAQIRALRSMGIRHHVRPDGHPVVLRADLVDQQRVTGRDAPGFVLDWGRP